MERQPNNRVEAGYRFSVWKKNRNNAIEQKYLELTGGRNS